MADFSPKRRENGVKVEEFQGEVLVYDLEHHTAHCLNGVAVKVWQCADGSMTVSDIADAVAAGTGEPADEALVWRALEELDRASLLETALADLPEDTSRRQLFTKIAWATAIPLVLSIAMPEPAFAQSALTGV